MSASKNTKIDREFQEQLYTSIALLNMIHQPSEDFLTVFRRDMFAKSNKAAFFQVVHYLLTVLNPELVKEKLITWPTLNVISRENKFRNEVLQVLNELNSIYEDANLPTVMSSHLVAPGGYKIIYFMYRLSQLVLYKELKKDNEVLQRPRIGKNEELNETVHANFRKVIADINVETNREVEKFEKKFEFFNKEAKKTMSEYKTTNNQLKNMKEEIDQEKSKINNLLDEELVEKFKTLQQKSIVINKITDAYTECESFISQLTEHSENGQIVDLMNSVKALSVSLERTISELPTYTLHELEQYLDEVEKKKKELQELESCLKIEHDSLVKTMDISKAILKNIIADLEDE
ncbi:hypothetical protein HHI36_017765 [Cryptolaemus montrouzieri]|uniref:HAUS augmin-like complex subunit 6 N-terminal domain-containing protein n=1 Tax=Cryptolaemus montrouzieri TaxID=559131 RepID=A0ABD2NNV0_9CUCU